MTTDNVTAKPIPSLKVANHIPVYEGGGYWDAFLGCSVHWVHQIWPPEDSNQN